MFIYFGQVNITQDSLQSFLKIAEKLKIKGKTTSVVESVIKSTVVS